MKQGDLFPILSSGGACRDHPISLQAAKPPALNLMVKRGQKPISNPENGNLAKIIDREKSKIRTPITSGMHNRAR